MPNNGTSVIRGVVSFGTEDNLGGSAVVYAETAHPGMTITFTTPKVPLEGFLWCLPYLMRAVRQADHHLYACLLHRESDSV